MLFEDSELNEARYEMGRFIRFKPFNPEVEVAGQHILLIRRIKALEARMVLQWQTGDVDGARRTEGVIRFLHPSYVESADVFSLLALKSPANPIIPKKSPEHEPVDKEAEARYAFLRPFLFAVVERQELLALRLAQQWEERRQSGSGRERAGTNEWKSDKEKERMLVALDSAYLELKLQSVETERMEVDRLSKQLEQMISSLDYPVQPSREIEELEWQSLKFDVFGTVLNLKSRFKQSGLTGS